MKIRYLSLFVLLLIYSCESDIPRLKEQTHSWRDSPRQKSDAPQGRTLLVYIALNNSLSGEIKDMHDALKEGWDSKTMGSLVILTHSKGDASPMLIKFKEHNNEIVADTLRRYINMSSASASLMSQVISDTQVLAPGDSYGMLLFSHASGWLPERSFIDPVNWSPSSQVRAQEIIPRSIFEDNKREMELSDFAAAIPDGMFDFIASEMCFMAGVEIAYALRNKTDYLLAAAPEVLSPGFVPIYPTSLGLLYKPEADLESFGQAFFDYFNSQQGLYKSAAISLIKTSEMEGLAALTRAIGLPLQSQEQIDHIQHYDGNYRAGLPHLFFDYRDYIVQSATPKQIEQLDEQLSKVVIFKQNTPKLINVTIAKHSGLSVYIPQTNLPRLNDAYKITDWYKALQ